MTGHTSVKQFIRNVRAAKTIADERAVIQKESASIRASFREESHNPSVRCATTTTAARCPNEGTRVLIYSCPGLNPTQAEQCRKAALPLHPRREDTLRPD